MRVSDSELKDEPSADGIELRSERPILPISENKESKKGSVHAAVYVTYAYRMSLHIRILTKLFSAWIAASSGTILYNKWLLDTLGFSECTCVAILQPC
jgi:hypothetical protein